MPVVSCDLLLEAISALATTDLAARYYIPWFATIATTSP
jgi:hypothetical protein